MALLYGATLEPENQEKIDADYTGGHVAEHKSPFSEDVYLVWESLAFPRVELSLDEKQKTWEGLHHRTRGDGKWLVNSYDAALVASHGAYLACERRELPDVMRICDEFLAHPEAKVELINFHHISSLRAAAAIISGDLESGVHALFGLIRARQRRRMPLLEVRQRLMWCLDELKDSDPPQPIMCQLVSETISRLKGSKCLATKALAARSHQELFDILDSTYEKKAPAP